jgi:hypothetical protein
MRTLRLCAKNNNLDLLTKQLAVAIFPPSPHLTRQFPPVPPAGPLDQGSSAATVSPHRNGGTHPRGTHLDTLFGLLTIIAAVGFVLAAMAFVADMHAYRACCRAIEDALQRPQSFTPQLPHLERRYGDRS